MGLHDPTIRCAECGDVHAYRDRLRPVRVARSVCPACGTPRLGEIFP